MKVTLRSYNYFPNFFKFSILEKCLPQLCQNYIIFIRKMQKNLGIRSLDFVVILLMK